MEIVISELTRKDIAPWTVASAMRTLKSLGDPRLGGLTPQRAQNILLHMTENSLYHLFAARLHGTGDVIGLATLIVEQKLIHNGGRVGHLEDVVVREEYRGKSIGTELVSKVSDCAQHQGCYKLVLQCDKSVAPFYENLGFQPDGSSMRANLPRVQYRGHRR